jgi:hypothetical protein
MHLRSVAVAMLGLALGVAPLACGVVRPLGSSSARVAEVVAFGMPLAIPSRGPAKRAPSIVDAGLLPPPDAQQLPEGGSLRPEDSSLLPEASGLPDAITPPMVDVSIPEVHPVPLSAWVEP